MASVINITRTVVIVNLIIALDLDLPTLSIQKHNNLPLSAAAHQRLTVAIIAHNLLLDPVDASQT
jgi:hypothetical protein